jgi:rhomboid protease GluP
LGFLPLVIWGSVGLFIASLLVDPEEIGMGGLFSLLSPSIESLFLFGASGAVPVFQYGRWWTVVSAAWLHGGLIHIAFNMMWVRQLAPATAEAYGAGRMVIIYTVSSITGFGLSSLAGYYLAGIPFLGGAYFTVGASAPVFGLLGALVFYGKRGGSSLVGRQAISYAVILFFFGIIMPGVDNYAHAGGFAGGYYAAQIMDPLLPERGDHLLLALGCLVVTVLSILVSILHGLTVF